MEKITVEQAKEVLRKSGYYVDNLWTVNDVKENHANADGSEVSDEIAINVLGGALKNEATVDQIWFAIREHSEMNGLVRNED